MHCLPPLTTFSCKGVLQQSYPPGIKLRTKVVGTRSVHWSGHDRKHFTVQVMIANTGLLICVARCIQSCAI